MIDFTKMTISLNGKDEPIMEICTWWVIPGKGLTASLKEAIEHGAFYPAPVALAESGVYELIPPEITIESPRN